MKKFMKLVLSAVLCIAMVLPTVAICFAADNIITITPKFDAVANELIISGSVQSNRGNIPLIMTVKKGSELVGYMETVSGDSQSGACAFVFEGVGFPGDALSADYDVYVSADFVRAENSIVYSYAGVDEKHKALQAVADADDKASMIAAIEDYGSSIGLDSSELTEDDMTIVAEMLLDGEYECPEGFTSESDIADVLSGIAQAAAIANEAMAVVEGTKLEDAADVEAWVDKYADEYGFYEDREDTEYDDAKVAEFFDEAELSSSLVSDMAAEIKATRSFNDAAQVIKDEAILELIYVSNNYKVKEIIEAVPELFEIDTVKFAKLSDGEKSKIYGTLGSGSYEDVTDVGDVVNKKTAAVLNGDDDDDDNGGGSRGGSGSGNSVLGGKLQGGADAADATVTGQVYVGFEDLEEYEWARPSIEALYRRGIVNGKDETHFAPGDLVTRAEFSKMVVEALGLKATSTDSGFSDVAADSWYAPYVAAARENGIVEGDGNKFNPEGAITREDIAVILFRAMEVEIKGIDETIFTDYNSISDYAKDAVIGLYEAGVVNGTGSGAFEPKNSATRAEAAKMIYLALCQG